MTPEELQSTMEFIVQQQAKFSDDIQDFFESDRQLREADERLREADERLRQSQATLTAALVRLTEIMEENERRTDARFTKMDGRFRETDKRFAELAEAQKAADERLEMFIRVVEGHLVRRRDGKKRRKQAN